MVVTKRNGENPVRTSVFFLSFSFFFFLLPSRFSRQEKKREMKENEWGRSVNPAFLLLCEV